MNGDDLDRRLGDLFQAPALNLVPRPGATTTVLTRVRQARRRRKAIQVAAPAFAAVVVLAGTVLSLNGGRDLGAPPATEVTTVAPRPTELVMTSDAVGPLRLGMSRESALATGLLSGDGDRFDTSHPRCRYYSGGISVPQVQVGDRGVHSIQVYPFIHTPEGLAVGDRFSDLHAAFPQSVPVTPNPAATEYRVPVPGQSGTWYEVVLETTDDQKTGPTVRSRISELYLQNEDPSCG
jgi:hypothetical protein